MREIRFRAWDKECEEMISADEFAFEEYLPLQDLFSDKTWVFMQYIGIKDRYQKEVYEGDIVIYDGNLYEIMYFAEDAMFILDGETIVENFGNISGSCVEIIGNIYENPEFLKGV